MYVDDIIGVSSRKDLKNDLDAARKVCTDLLGDNAIQDGKTVFMTELDRRVDVIGYKTGGHLIEEKLSQDNVSVLRSR